MRLIQFESGAGERQVGVVDGEQVQVVRDCMSTRELALAASRAGRSLQDEVASRGSEPGPRYSELLAAGRVLPPLDHQDPAHCLVSGTLATIADLVAASSLQSPSIIIVGEVVRLHETLGWFGRSIELATA